MAVECRSTYGVIFLPIIVGQVWAAVRACLATHRCRASRLSWWPRRVENTGSVDWPARSVSQTRNMVAMLLVRGCDALFAALAVAAEMRPRAREVDVVDDEHGEFGGVQPGLDGDSEHGAVAASGPCVLVGCL
jgi:hypothetical protein